MPGWEILETLRRGQGWGAWRAGLATQARMPVLLGLVAVRVLAASSLSRILVRVGNGLGGPTFTIPDPKPGSLALAPPGNSNPPGHSVDAVHIVAATIRQRAPEFQLS